MPTRTSWALERQPQTPVGDAVNTQHPIHPHPNVLHTFPRRRRHTGCGRDAHRALMPTTLVPARLGLQSIVILHPPTHPPHPASPYCSILAPSTGSLVSFMQSGHTKTHEDIHIRPTWYTIRKGGAGQQQRQTWKCLPHKIVERQINDNTDRKTRFVVMVPR
ncbi:unnamed protein product [Ectocarpus fasciculatus]